MRKWYLLFLIIVPLLFMGCESEGDDDDDDDDHSTEVVQGWHFQGRDCLSCHNIDLNTDKKLLTAGTLYKSATVTDVDDMSQVCGGDFVLNFLDSSYATQVSSKFYEDDDSKGYKGKGNVFILSRKLDTLNGDYFVQIIEKNTNKTLAISEKLHKFSASGYSLSSSADNNNRNACNACHKNGGDATPLYVQVNKDLCE